MVILDQWHGEVVKKWLYLLWMQVHLAIAAWSWPSYFSPEKILDGIRLTTSKWVRPSPNSAPTDSKAAGLYMICSLVNMKQRKMDSTMRLCLIIEDL